MNADGPAVASHYYPYFTGEDGGRERFRKLLKGTQLIDGGARGLYICTHTHINVCMCIYTHI